MILLAQYYTTIFERQGPSGSGAALVAHLSQDQSLAGTLSFAAPLASAMAQDQKLSGTLTTGIPLISAMTQDQKLAGTLTTGIPLTSAMSQDQVLSAAFRGAAAALASTMSQDQSFTATLTTLPLAPNPNNTIAPQNTGYDGTYFKPNWQPETKTFTFDVSALLGPGDTVTSLIEFTITPEDPQGALDPMPSARTLGLPSIQGALISQRFGNWQALSTSITYQLEVLFVTAQGYTLSSISYVDVLPVPGNSWSDA